MNHVFVRGDTGATEVPASLAGAGRPRPSEAVVDRMPRRDTVIGASGRDVSVYTGNVV
ncbi:hypothetical protein [Lentzea indica]|uniref:hypothetical protein n=1 Tax=Lentzea indica TaxID=2604800 RepID=UPI001439CDD3|nr:hypothetical protein [Lentzea indica]